MSLRIRFIILVIFFLVKDSLLEQDSEMIDKIFAQAAIDFRLEMNGLQRFKRQANSTTNGKNC
jgi:hypothetical protein